MNTVLVEHIITTFKYKFNKVPTVLYSPGRINLIGEHTDYNQGFVFPAAIDKGIIAAISKSNSNYCIAYAINKNESFEFLLDNIHTIKNGDWKNYVLGIVSELQKKKYEIKPFNIVFGGDIPVGAGLSSSAALENSIVFGLNTIFNLNLTKLEMILISQQAEHNFAGVKCGIMDQYASMFGVENTALLLDCRTLEMTPFKIDFKGFELVLINTNVRHNLAESAYNDRRLVCKKIASLLNIKALRDITEKSLQSIKQLLTEEDFQKALYIIQENKRVQKSAKAINDNNIRKFGKLLFKAHVGMKSQFKISCKELDFLVDRAKEHPDVIGARMMGGGFGGCTINVVKSEAVKEFTEKASKLYFKEFGVKTAIYFVKLSKGTHIVNV